jgi:hypothetical protein
MGVMEFNGYYYHVNERRGRLNCHRNIKVETLKRKLVGMGAAR